MKNMKRLVSMVLVLLMVFAMGTAAFATDEGEVAKTVTKGTITVDNPQAGTTYTAYKIFDVVYNEKQTAYSYTIDKKTSKWYDTVKAYSGEENGLKLQEAAGAQGKVVVIIDDTKFSAPQFALALQAALTKIDVKGQELEAGSDGKPTISGLDLGYYFVTSDTGALCNLTTTNPNVTIHDKNDIPFDKTENKQSFDVGESVEYTITGEVPDYSSFETFTYQITDKMSDGLTFNKDVKVYINEVELTENFDLKTGEDAGEYDFVLDIDVMKFEIGQKIEVKYSATVNEKAVAQIEENDAILKYSNDPTDDAKFGERRDKEYAYSARIVIDKYAAGSEETKLAGAEFVLYKKVTDQDTQEESNLYYKWNGTDKKVEWVKDKTQATVVITNDEGAASFDGLADGTYYLEETKAPDGYNLLEEAKEVKIDGKDATTENLSSLTNTVKVANETGKKLPETGGMGTTIFYVVGGVLVLGAVVLLVTKKRMASR